VTDVSRIDAASRLLDRPGAPAPLRRRSAPRDQELIGVISPEHARARLAAIIDSSDDAIVSKDLKGIITSWNPAAERLFGYSAAEAIGQPIGIIIPPARQGEAADVLRRISRGESVTHYETVRRRKDGSELFISLTVSPIRDEQGEIIGASKIARDITQRKRETQRAAFYADMSAILAGSFEYEAALANLSRLAVTIFPGAATSFADYSLVDVADTGGRLRRVAAAHRNPEKEHLLERAKLYAPDPARSLLARPLHTGQPLFLEKVTAADIETISRDTEHSRIMAALGPRSVITVPLTARGATFGLLTVVRSERADPFDAEDLHFTVEIGRRAALFADNARLYAESRQAVRTREHVLAVVSHDLRNALSAISTSARLLLVAPSDATQRTRRAETIIRVCDRVNRLVNDLLDASRLQGGHPLAVEPAAQEVGPMIREACESHRARFEEKMIALNCSLAPGLPPVLADRDRVHQVLSNLLANAVKFTPEGGSIQINGVPSGEFVQVSVSDTGPGIRAEDLPRIFERFWQATDTASLGTGLGLPIAKGIVEAHGGRIWADSKAGIGTTFYFTLPVSAP
jgi:PAS domain S-box-containing protein